MQNLRNSLSRRTFLKGSAAAAAGAAWLGPLSLARAEGGDKLRIAAIGVGNYGWTGIEQLNSHPDVAINALVDVDSAMLASTTEKGGFVSPTWSDVRKLFAESSDIFDAVYIATPDHMHAPIAMMALNADKHVYCEPSLATTAKEARALGMMSLNKFGVVTQLGTQGQSLPSRRFAIAQLRAGVVGPIKAMHAFTDAPTGWWPNGAGYGSGEDATPDTLDWDLWLGGAAERPYQDGLYHPGNWYGNTDFGSGAIGTMGPHIFDVAWLALGLTYPATVKAEVEGAADKKYPDQSKITFGFEANRRTAADGMTVTWYDGGLTPDKAEAGIPADFDLKSDSLVIVGEEGTMVVHSDGNALFKGGAAQPFETDEGLDDRNHYHLWVDACMGFGECDMAFGVAARLTETLMVGRAASLVPGTELAYDSSAQAFTGNDAATALLSRDYRQGWGVPNL